MRLMRGLLWLAVFGSLLWVGYKFPTQNGDVIAINYLFGQFEAVPIWAALLVAFGAGALLASLVAGLRVARMSLAARRYRKAVTALESEVHQLRNLPLSPDSDDAEAPQPLESNLGLERGS